MSMSGFIITLLIYVVLLGAVIFSFVRDIRKVLKAKTCNRSNVGRLFDAWMVAFATWGCIENNGIFWRVYFGIVIVLIIVLFILEEKYANKNEKKV